MIPFLIAGVGFLIGSAVVGTMAESEKKTLRSSITNLEEANFDLNQKLHQATDREVKHRIELVQATLQWIKSRLENMLTSDTSNISQLERLYSLSICLERIIEQLPSSGILDQEDKKLVDILSKFQSKIPLSNEDRGYIEDYLDKNVGDIRRDFLEDRLATVYKTTSKNIRKLYKEKDQKELELLTAERRMHIEGTAVEITKILRARIERLAVMISEAESRLEDIELSLVVLTRVSRPDEAHDDYDHAALECVQLLARGERLTSEESTFLHEYRDRYFSTAREILKRTRNIDLALQLEAA